MAKSKAKAGFAGAHGSATVSIAEMHKLLAFALAQHEAHKGTAWHEKPPCGGCHWWQGYAAALADLISGERPKPIGAQSPNVRMSDRP